MSQKKTEKNEQEYISDSFVNTLWDQYEDAIQRSRKLREEGSEAYIKALQETSSFNSDFRNAFFSFYEQTKKANTEVLNQLQQKKTGEEGSALQHQVQDIASRFENLMLTPVKSSLNILERVEKRTVENTQAYLKYQQKLSEERSTSTDKYIKLASGAHQQLVRRVEDSLRVLVSAKG